jgi:acetyl-CoA C-acetyltransferase
MTELREAVICTPLRTPVGRMGGALAPLSALQLATHVVRAVVDRSKVAPDAVDRLIMAQCYPTMEAPALGRVVALDAGLPVGTTGYQLDERCGSGLQAVLNAALAIAGGVESMSNAPLYTEQGRRGIPDGGLLLRDALARGRETVGGRDYPTPDGNVGTAETLRREYGITRVSRGRRSSAATSIRAPTPLSKRSWPSDRCSPARIPSRRLPPATRAARTTPPPRAS